MGMIANNQIGNGGTCGLILCHLIHATLLESSRRFKHQIVDQVERKVAAVVDVGARPGIAYSINGHRALRSDEEVMNVDVALAQCDFEGYRAILARYILC